MSPFLDITKISEITRQLPQAMQDKGFEIRILMPRFGNINERRNRLHEVIRLSGMNIIINDNDNPLIIKVASIPSARMQVYFLDNDDYFQRKHVFADKDGKFYTDNDERMIFFCKGAIETVKKLGWSPDIVHCHGWMSALVPVYLKTTYKDDPTFKHSKIVYSIYDKGFTEQMDAEFANKAIMNEMTEEHVEAFKPGNAEALDAGAIKYSDGIVLGTADVAAETLNNVKNSQKPVLEFADTAEFENYYNFYDEITNEELVQVG
ncbi:glycogen/starch synthase [Mucilaginibacter myungsuensis]